MPLPLMATAQWQTRTLLTDEYWKADGPVQVSEEADPTTEGYFPMNPNESIRFLSGSAISYRSATQETKQIFLIGGGVI